MVKSKKLVLVVDDDAQVREVLVDFLNHLGYKTIGLDDGARVLPFCEQMLPDLVVSDIRMPELDGISLLGGLKQNAATRNIPVIFISAYADDAMMDAARRLGAACFLSKPFMLDTLDEIVTKVLAPADHP